MKTIIAIALFLSISSAVWADESGEEIFKNSLEYMRTGDYKSAIEGFETALVELPEITDYVQYYRAMANLKAGNRETAISALEGLLKDCPSGPLKRTALGALIKAYLEDNPEKATGLMESYLRSYPEDEDMKYLLAERLKEKSPQRAKSLFKEIFIGAGRYSSISKKQLEPSEITTKDIIAYSENLIKYSRFSEAETALRALPNHNETSLKLLSTALFRQKKYKEAGESYLRARDIYMSALAFFRAGDYERFKNNIKRLESNGDERAGGLLISYASDRRRKGYIEDALNILSSVSERYPSERERALWERGWTFYISNDYERAFKVFSELALTYKKSKYIYWRARTAERLKDNPSEIYSELQSEKDFYGLLAIARTKKEIKRTSLSLTKENDSLKEETKFKRFRLLNSVGLKKEAVEEIIYASRGFSSKDEILSAAYELVSLGEYRRAIALVLELPEPERPTEILYPIAFWEHIDSACSTSAVDPLLVLSVIREESRYDPNALSPVGAIGVMQIMPRTAEHLAKDVGLRIDGTKDIYNLDTNIRLGVFYLKNLIDDFGSIVPALAAYNAGEYKVREWLSQRNYEIDEFIEDIPYKETREYVKRIITSYLRYHEFLRAGAEDFSILKMPQLVD